MVSIIRYALLAALFAPVVLAEPFSQRLQAQANAAEALRKARVLERLADEWRPTANAAQAPGFVVDPAWPKRLPNNWIIGDVGGITVDRRDHIWVYHRPRALSSLG